MDVQLLKDKILEEDKIDDILTELGCHHIKHNSGYITCGNPDGDNPVAVTVYLNESLTCVNYTRQLLSNSQTRATDLIDLVMYVKELNFFKALQWICSICGYDYYTEEEELPPSLELLHYLTKMNKESTIEEEDNTPVKPIDEKILDYYLPYGNKMWEDDGISLQTQEEFSGMYDPRSNRIILPLYDAIGSLVGIKGRLMKRELEDGEQKYIYMQNFNKSKYIFGLNKTIDMITRQGYCPIFEGEKSVLIAYEHGIGSVAVCGCKISKYQANVLTRLNVPLIICFDKDKTIEEIKTEASKFMESVPVSYIFDNENLLEEKESPVDTWRKWKHLIKNNIYKTK